MLLSFPAGKKYGNSFLTFSKSCGGVSKNILSNRSIFTSKGISETAFSILFLLSQDKKKKQKAIENRYIFIFIN
jgi:hypothetical protein